VPQNHLPIAITAMHSLLFSTSRRIDVEIPESINEVIGLTIQHSDNFVNKKSHPDFEKSFSLHFDIFPVFFQDINFSDKSVKKIF